MKRHPVMLWGVGGGFVVALIAAVAIVRAASTSANLNVSATVIRNCTISTAAVAFGSYDPIVANATANLDATGTVTVACTKGTTATIGLDLGQNAAGSARRMTAGLTDRLGYELYKDTGRTTIWGNSGGDLFDPGAAPSKKPRSFDVYGRVAAGQDVEAGAFADVVVATINF